MTTPLRPRRYPTRTCVTCRTSRQKRELVRVVRTPTGEVVMDETGRLAGRGAYLCADGSCWRQALDKGILQRALEAPLPEALKQQLRAGAGAGANSADGSEPVRSAATNGTIDEMNGGEAIGQE